MSMPPVKARAATATTAPATMPRLRPCCMHSFYPASRRVHPRAEGLRSASRCVSGRMIEVRTLLLLRHAKSSWDDAQTVGDHDRPLAPAVLVPRTGSRPIFRLRVSTRPWCCARRLVARSRRSRRCELRSARPQRCRSNPTLVRRRCFGDPGAAPDRRCSDPQVLVIGHNPGLQDLAIELSGEGDAALLDQLRTEVPYRGARDVRRSRRLGRARPRPRADRPTS